MKGYKWHEDPDHTNLYEAETGTLQRGLGGDFELIKLYDPGIKEGRVVAIGLLSFEEGKKQGIQIIFPTKYPYSAPKIVTVGLNIDPAGNLIEPVVPINYGKGNQYVDGTMCLLEQNMWNSQEHNIGWVLRRAQKWLRSLNSPDGFKPEEIVEEYPTPIKHSGQVLLPTDIKLPNNAKTGEFWLTQFKPLHYILEQNIIPMSPFSLSINKESFKWYNFEEGITFKELFPDLNAPTIYNLFLNHFNEDISEGEQIKNIAIHLPSDKNPWHFFKLKIKRTGLQISIEPFYFIARIIDQELYLRTKDIFDDQILLKKRVTIIGLGAIGSEVAKSLAKNGVGNFNLIDSDTFEIGNSVRHAADLFFIGEDKVNVVKQLILRSNPNIIVNAYKTDILNDPGFLELCLEKSDLCLILTAEDSVDYLINDKYIKNFNLPFIFARVSAGGVSGSVQIVDQGSACLRCLSKQDLDKLPVPRKRISFKELPPEYGSCSSPAVPGSEIDTKEIALQVSRISLQILLGNKSTSYPKLKYKQYYWHGPFGSEKYSPFEWEMKNHKKSIDCKICK